MGVDIFGDYVVEIEAVNEHFLTGTYVTYDFKVAHDLHELYSVSFADDLVYVSDAPPDGLRAYEAVARYVVFGLYEWQALKQQIKGGKFR